MDHVEQQWRVDALTDFLAAVSYDQVPEPDGQGVIRLEDGIGDVTETVDLCRRERLIRDDRQAACRWRLTAEGEKRLADLWGPDQVCDGAWDAVATRQSHDALTADQAALAGSVIVHASISGTDPVVLLPKIGAQLGSSPHDLRVVAHSLGIDR